MLKRRAFTCLAAATIAAGDAIRADPQASYCQAPADHWAWVVQALIRIETIKPGMTREALLKIFTTEGGIIFNDLIRTFVSRDCPYFKIDVEFEAVGRPSKADASRVTGEGGNKDLIVKISRPYLQFGIRD